MNNAKSQLAPTGKLRVGVNHGNFLLVQKNPDGSIRGIVADLAAELGKRIGAPVEFVFPEEGVSAVTEPVAILKTAQNPEAAKAFIDFILSEEGQELAAEQGYLPAHPDVAAPEGFPSRDQIRLLDFDPADLLANDAEYKLRFTEIFGG